jgi:hypothetical protein
VLLSGVGCGSHKLTGDAGIGSGGDGGGAGGVAGGGTAGASGAGPGGGGVAGGPPPRVDVTTAFDGQEYLLRCGSTSTISELVCSNPSPIPYCGGSTSTDFLMRGHVMRDDTVTVDGPSGAVYDVTLRVRGVVEPRHYTGGARGSPANGSNYGWYVGGLPSNAGDFNIYMLWVSSPVVSPTDGRDGQFYFLNAINQSEAHFCYPLDYTLTLPVAAGAQVRFFAIDSNCSMVRNCDESSVDGYPGGATVKCNPITLVNLPDSAGISQPYPGQFIYLTVESVVTRAEGNDGGESDSDGASADAAGGSAGMGGG